eukprot:m.202332 g.202332  ORF g.202332 m.202332 type:complete len:441 (-) comp15359_c0_seq5:2478-3800(-)
MRWSLVVLCMAATTASLPLNAQNLHRTKSLRTKRQVRPQSVGPTLSYRLDSSSVSPEGGVSPRVGEHTGALLRPQGFVGQPPRFQATPIAPLFTPPPESLLFVGTALSSPFVSVAGITQDVLPVRDISVEAWVIVSTVSQSAAIVAYGQDNGGDRSGFSLGIGRGGTGWYWGVADSAGLALDVSSRSSPEVNRWTHIVGTWDGTTSRLFIDGAEVASIDQPGAAISYPPPSTTNFTIGAFLDTDEYEALQGAILEINVFDRVLPPAEVLLRHCFVSIDGLPPSTACDAPLQTTTPTPQPTRVPSSSPTASPTVDATSESGEQGRIPDTTSSTTIELEGDETYSSTKSSSAGKTMGKRKGKEKKSSKKTRSKRKHGRSIVQLQDSSGSLMVATVVGVGLLVLAVLHRKSGERKQLTALPPNYGTIPNFKESGGIGLTTVIV